MTVLFPNSFFSTRQASTSGSISADARILWRESVTSYAVSLQRVLCRIAYAAQRVYEMCDGLKVRWIHALRRAAQVIQFESVRDWPDDVFIGPAMSKDTTSVEMERSVAGIDQASSPQPTWAEFWTARRDRAVPVNLRPEAITDRASAFRSCVAIAVSAIYAASTIARTEALIRSSTCQRERNAAAFTLSGSIFCSHSAAPPVRVLCGQERAGVSSTRALRLFYHQGLAV